MARIAHQPGPVCVCSIRVHVGCKDIHGALASGLWPFLFFGFGARAQHRKPKAQAQAQMRDG
jgi:hypothetical protein